MIPYIIGFILSVLLTLSSYYLVVKEYLSGHALLFSLMGLAIVQLFVQLWFFLHLGAEPKPRRSTIVFLFMVMVVVIIGGGSIWIMLDLNERVMNMASMK